MTIKFGYVWSWLLLRPGHADILFSSGWYCYKRGHLSSNSCQLLGVPKLTNYSFLFPFALSLFCLAFEGQKILLISLKCKFICPSTSTIFFKTYNIYCGVLKETPNPNPEFQTFKHFVPVGGAVWGGSVGVTLLEKEWPWGWALGV